MKVRAILIPAQDLMLLKPTDTAAFAVDYIEKNGFLSLPVVDGKKFIGFLSKQYIYDSFFKDHQTDIIEFLKRPVSEFIYQEIEPISADYQVEEAAQIFFKEKIRFIPVVDAHNDFQGIVTQNVLFGILTKIYGLKNAKISILTDNFKGTLSRITEIISKYDGNITNVVLLDTEVMGIQEISIRLDATDVDKIVKKLQEKGFEVREYLK